MFLVDSLCQQRCPYRSGSSVSERPCLDRVYSVPFGARRLSVSEDQVSTAAACVCVNQSGLPVSLCRVNQSVGQVSLSGKEEVRKKVVNDYNTT